MYFPPWSIEFSEFDIQYEPKGPIKEQHLAGFINEFHPAWQFEDQWRKIHVDNSSNQNECWVKVLLEGPNQVTLEQSLRFGFKVSNNQVEYEALLVVLLLAKEMGAKKIKYWRIQK